MAFFLMIHEHKVQNSNYRPDNFHCIPEDGFGREEQIRLSNVFKKLASKGCYVMLSNHNTKLINDLYKDYNIHVVEAKRNINANGKKRGKVEEVIITNYETGDEK